MNVQIVFDKRKLACFLSLISHKLQTTRLYNEIEFWTDIWKKVDLDNRLIILYVFKYQHIRGDIVQVQCNK